MGTRTLSRPKGAVVLNLEQGSQDWLLWRQKGIGSSDAAAILGVSPWMTALQLWETKTGRREGQPVTAAMQRGTDLEADARREFEWQHGTAFPPACLIHPEHDYLKASLDGYDPAGATVLEIKCPGAAAHSTALAGQVPDYYLPQIDHLLLVSGAGRCCYWSYEPEAGGVLVTVERDEARIAALLEAEQTFWGYVQRDEPPPQSERDVLLRVDDEWAQAATAYAVADAAVKRAGVALDAAKAALLELAGGNRCVGCGVKVTPYEMAGRIDYKAAGKELADILGEPVDWEKWRGASTTACRVTVER